MKKYLLHIDFYNSLSPSTCFLLCTFYMFLISCEKDITIELQENVEEKIVVEGHIEAGLPPYIFLTKTMDYFAPADANTFERLYIHGADVKVYNGFRTIQLKEYCSHDYPKELYPIAAQYLGVSIANLSDFNLCVYTLDIANVDSANMGAAGMTYELTINVEGKTISAVTTVLQPVPLDSLWFEELTDNKGYIWARLTDPPQTGNYYRIFTKRQGVDEYFVPPESSVFNDQQINGSTVDFFIEGSFAKGDTVVAKWCAIDKAHYDFWRTAEIEIQNSGNPIASPTLVITNITGGLGIWGGYSPAYDTLIVE